MRDACAAAGVSIVTGDTKVVDRGKGDQIFITTTGVGIVPSGRFLSVRNARPGDKILISGTIGDHGVAIMSVREGIEFETVLESDSAALHDLTRVMLAECPSIRWMRDPTRGGLSSSRPAERRNIGDHQPRGDRAGRRGRHRAAWRYRRHSRAFRVKRVS